MVKLFEHFGLKLIALVLGFMLWFHVATEKVYNYQVLLPITEVVVSEGLTLAQNPPDSILVVVSGTGKQIMRKKWLKGGVRIIATQFKIGRHSLRLTPSNLLLAYEASGISLDDIIAPTSVPLHVDILTEVEVDVIPDIDAEPANGFAIGDISRANPPQVTMVGPRSVIRNHPAIKTIRKELRDLRNSLSLVLPLALPEGYGVDLRPDSVRVNVDVVPVKTRVFNDIPVVVYNAPPETAIYPEPATIRIELTGPPAEIDLLNRNALIASADYKQTNEEGRAVLKIDCPSRFKVKKVSADSVLLQMN